MPRPGLIWLDDPGLEGLDPALVARAAQVDLAESGRGLGPEAAVVTRLEAQTPEHVKAMLRGKPVQWLDLAAEVGGGEPAHRLARAVAAVARAAGRASLGTLPPVYAPQPAQRVLVFGQGVAALLAAHAAAALGHPVLLAWSGENPSQPAAGDDPEEAIRLGALLPAGVELAPRTNLASLEGAAGAFSAWLEDLTGRRAERFGAVMLAPPATWATEALPAGLDPSLTIPLEEVPDPPEGQPWRRVAILAGVSGPATAVGFSRALNAALELQAQPRVQTHVFFREALVAAPGGERLYRQAREAGALMVRVPEGGLRTTAGGRGLAWEDALLGEELELLPDLVLASARLEASTPEALTNPALWPEWRWLAPEHARLSGGRTACSGLFLLGALRGAESTEAARVQAAAAAAEAHDLLGGRATPLPVVRHNYCASCLTCVRVCPHGVPRYENDCITPAPAACVGCGICAAECPAQAIAPVGWAQNELLEGLKRGLALAAKPALVVMACGQSAMPAARELSLAGHQWPAGVLWLPLPCAGRAGIELILRTLAMGSSGVLVAGCHEGMCRSLAGNLRARLRVGEAAATLRELGLSADAVAFLPLASNQPLALKDAVTALHGRLAARGE